MTTIVMVLFFVFLLIGVPISFVVFGAASIGIVSEGTSIVILLQQLFQGMNSFTRLAVPFFIMSGDIASKGRTSERLIDVINAFMGHMRGGLGMACVVACVFFGAITGSAIACVVAIGAFMMPKLLESGYPRRVVLGIITAAGTLGVMIPPSVPMLSYSLAMGNSVSRLFTAGFLPGILTAGAFCLYVYIVARKENVPLTGVKLTWKQRLLEVKRSIWALLFPVIVLGGIYGGLTTPTEAAVVSLFYVIAVELLVYKKIKLKDMFPLLAKSLISSATLTLTIATAQVFVWYLTTSQVTAAIYSAMTSFFTSANALLLVMCVLFLIAGCFTNVITVVVILGPIIAGVLQYFGIDLIHFGVVSILMAQVGFLTPPFGLCLFTTMKVANASMAEVSKATWPFIFIMLACVMVFVFVPDISLFLPNLVFGVAGGG